MNISNIIKMINKIKELRQFVWDTNNISSADFDKKYGDLDHDLDDEVLKRIDSILAEAGELE